MIYSKKTPHDIFAWRLEAWTTIRREKAAGKSQRRTQRDTGYRIQVVARYWNKGEAPGVVPDAGVKVDARAIVPPEKRALRVLDHREIVKRLQASGWWVRSITDRPVSYA